MVIIGARTVVITRKLKLLLPHRLLHGVEEKNLYHEHHVVGPSQLDGVLLMLVAPQVMLLNLVIVEGVNHEVETVHVVELLPMNHDHHHSIQGNGFLVLEAGVQAAAMRV